jgi:hypothetical protein
LLLNRYDLGGKMTAISGALDVSLFALRYAAGWNDNVERTSMRLYRFNSAPRNPVYMRMLGDAVSARQYLCRAARLDRSGDADGYRLNTADPAGWLLWRDVQPHPVSALVGTRKVYVTAKLDYLPITLHAVSRAARAAGVTAFKFGADYANLRRPDRIVMYARDREHAGQIADLLRPVLDEVPADALTFAECLSSAIFTGLDPPTSLPGLPDGIRSWRGWLCRSLAESLCQAGRRDPQQAVAAALARARELAIDPSSWAIDDDFFANMAGAV